MARGRHVRRTGLLVWLFATSVQPAPRDTSWRAVHAQSLVLLADDVRTLESELAGLRSGQRSVQITAQATAEAAAGLAERRVARLEEQLAAASSEIAALRAELTALREELVWAFAERRTGRAPGADRSGAGGSTAVRPVASAG